MSEQPLGVAVVGAGHIIKRHALALQALPELGRRIAVADVNRKRAVEAKERFGFEHACEDYREVLQRGDVDVITVCTPAGVHSQVVIDALEAGKHVLCEKPITTTLADADEIIALADKHPGQTVSCVFQLRSDPVHQRMQWMIQQGQIGRVLLARMCVRLSKSRGYYSSAPGRGSWSLDGGGVVINQAVHQLDALLWLLGEATEVSAVMDTFVHRIEAEDTLVGWVRFRSGAIASIECTTCAKNKEFSIDVVGESAGMRISGDPDSQQFDWRVLAKGSSARKSLHQQGQKAHPSPPDPKGIKVRMQKLSAKIRKRDWVPPLHWGHSPFVRDFLVAARKGQPGPVPPREARRTLELAMGLYEAAIKGRPVTLPLDKRSAIYHGNKNTETPYIREGVETLAH